MNVFFKWVKRILFTLVMATSAIVSACMVLGSQGLSLFLGIISIVLAIGCCVLYFMFNESQKWSIVLCLIALFADSIYLAISVEGNIYGVCVASAFIGFIISCGVKWLKPETYRGVEYVLIRVAECVGFLAGIGAGVYMLFFKK